jgi:UDP-glucose 4-epimerase
VERALRGDALTIFGDGEQGRDFVSVKDVARANAAGLRGQPGVYNVGTGRMLTVNALAARVRAIVGDVPVTHLAEREGDVRLSCADVSAARAGLGWSASEAFEGALDETIRWFREP